MNIQTVASVGFRRLAMGIKTAIHPLGGSKKAAYKPGTVVDKKNGAAVYDNAKQGIGLYYLKLAAGGGWGSVGYYNNPGGGAGAAWEGYIFLRKETHLVINAGAAGQPSSLYINDLNVMTLGRGNNNGGGGGISLNAEVLDVVRTDIAYNGGGGGGNWSPGKSGSTEGWGAGAAPNKTPASGGFYLEYKGLQRKIK